MIITVNGQSEEITPCSLEAYILGKGLETVGVVVEHNYRIVKRDEWDTIQLRDKDNLEILSFVGGG